TVQNLDNVTVTNLSASDPQAQTQYLQTLQPSPAGAQTDSIPLFAPRNNLTMSYTVTTGSSGIYVLSPSTVKFDWTAPNGTRITYSMNSDPVQVDSLSGPWIQLTRGFTDFQPYSYLLLLPLILTPVIETYKLSRRRAQRKREQVLLAVSAQAPPPQQSPANPPEATKPSNSPSR
ncbi:MAG TPA: hypothetical protein VE955_05370, partial [Candidatus Dormibacteraeota bacterium]|nr:hypothetical protein [Candidatus Dormibacteraeota bacterium]